MDSPPTYVALVARMTEALVESRMQIGADRESLFENVVHEDRKTVGDRDKPALDEYDRVLGLIDGAIEAAKGES